MDCFMIRSIERISVMEFAKGVKVPFPEKIEKGYVVEENCITANIDIEDMDAVVMDFVEVIDEPMYIGIHVPLDELEELELRKSEDDPFHEKVYYLDNCNREDMRLIIDTFMDILINDGLSKFVIASHTTGDEMFVQKYNVVSFFSDDTSKIEELLGKWGCEKKDELIIASDTFTQENPGCCFSYENEDGINIYDLIDALTQSGMYASEIIEC